jgi:hypothetical protein
VRSNQLSYAPMGNYPAHIIIEERHVCKQFDFWQAPVRPL